MSYLKTLFYALAMAGFMLFVLSRQVQANENFSTNYETTYTVSENGETEVEENITLTNKTSEIYATSYTLVLEGEYPEQVKATQNQKEIPSKVDTDGPSTKITLNFPEAKVGKNSTQAFTVSYKLKKAAVQNGQVWEISLPKITSLELFETYNTTLKVPETFGVPAYVSPEPRKKYEEGKFQVFTFQKEDLAAAGVVAAFGQFQVFSFNINYHLSNPYKDKRGQTEIALIPDTSFQRVYYQNITPLPEKIEIDEDGNWLGKYTLPPGARITVTTLGAVQLFSKPQDYHSKVIPKNYHLSENEQYWQTSNTQIQQTAQNLKTPRQIYDFVTNYLNYDYSRVGSGISRLGAVNALLNQNSAVCMEFTDLFITLARAANIPAREVNGYAYTENPEIQPLSLVADVLHAWPEYWDAQNQIWKPGDPTWGKTTGGVDFFDKFDLNHITFVNHGKNPTEPLPAGSYKLAENPQKDVNITFGQLPETRSSTAQIELKPVSLPIPFLPQTFKVVIYNPGPTAIYNQTFTLNPQNIKIDQDYPEKIPFIAPFQKEEISLEATLPLSSIRQKSTLSLFLDSRQVDFEIPYTRTILFGITTIFIVIFLVTGTAFGAIKLVKKG